MSITQDNIKEASDSMITASPMTISEFCQIVGTPIPATLEPETLGFIIYRPGRGVPDESGFTIHVSWLTEEELHAKCAAVH